MILRIVSYKGEGTLVNRIIRYTTGSIYSHIGAVIRGYLYDIDYWHNFRKQDFFRLWDPDDYLTIVFSLPPTVGEFVINYLERCVAAKIKYSMWENFRYRLWRLGIKLPFLDDADQPNCVESMQDMFILIEKEFNIFGMPEDEKEFWDGLIPLSVGEVTAYMIKIHDRYIAADPILGTI